MNRICVVIAHARRQDTLRKQDRTMKQLLAAVTLAALIASPAVAKSHHAMSPRIYGAHAAAPSGSNAVIWNGQVIGADPDAAIRTQLYRGAYGPT
jgi:hypothetical protein